MSQSTRTATPPQKKSQSPSTATKRLLHELQDYSSAPNDCLLHLGPVRDDDLLFWEAVLKGVRGSTYEGGLWLLKIEIPTQYPLAPPKITFQTPISHPNIHFKTGEICLTLLTPTHWSPAYTLSSTLSAIHQLLTDPSPDSPLNVDIANLYREGDNIGAEALVRYCTGEYRWKGEGEGFWVSEYRPRRESGPASGVSAPAGVAGSVGVAGT